MSNISKALKLPKDKAKDVAMLQGYFPELRDYSMRDVAAIYETFCCEHGATWLVLDDATIGFFYHWLNQ